MKLFRSLFALIALSLLVACGPPKPTAGVSVGADGVGAGVGVESGRVNAGVSTGGAYAGVDVVQTERVDVGVGTNGASASVRVGDGPFRIGYGRGGFRLGI